MKRLYHVNEIEEETVTRPRNKRVKNVVENVDVSGESSKGEVEAIEPSQNPDSSGLHGNKVDDEEYSQLPYSQPPYTPEENTITQQRNKNNNKRLKQQLI